MKVDKDKSRGSARAINSFSRIVDACVEHGGDETRLKSVCEILWPGCQFYRGHTHLRVTPYTGASFYVSMEAKQ